MPICYINLSKLQTQMNKYLDDISEFGYAVAYIAALCRYIYFKGGKVE